MMTEEEVNLKQKEELVQKIINYIMKTPHNTNVNILREMLNELQNFNKNSIEKPNLNPGGNDLPIEGNDQT